VIPFHELRVSGETSADLVEDYKAIRTLLSACTPDFASFLLYGKLDREAIKDCALFLSKVLEKDRSRPAAMWAIEMYFMLILNEVFQLGGTAQEEVTPVGLGRCW
jgi:hypothetical protein